MTVLEFASHLRQQGWRHIRIEVFDHAKPQPRQPREIRDSQFGAGLLGFIQDRIRTA